MFFLKLPFSRLQDRPFVHQMLGKLIRVLSLWFCMNVSFDQVVVTVTFDATHLCFVTHCRALLRLFYLVVCRPKIFLVYHYLITGFQWDLILLNCRVLTSCSRPDNLRFLVWFVIFCSPSLILICLPFRSVLVGFLISSTGRMIEVVIEIDGGIVYGASLVSSRSLRHYWHGLRGLMGPSSKGLLHSCRLKQSLIIFYTVFSRCESGDVGNYFIPDSGSSIIISVSHGNYFITALIAFLIVSSAGEQ